MQFALMIYHAPEEFAMRKNDYSDPHLGAWRAYYKALVEAGVYVGANALEVPETGTTVRLKEGKRRVQDGPYAETKEQLAGFIIDRKSTRLNSSHGYISYAVFCLKKKKVLDPPRRPSAY